MIREDDVTRAQQSTQTTAEVIAAAKAEERQRWRAAFNHPRADECRDMIAKCLGGSDMSAEEIHKLLQHVPSAEGTGPTPATPMDEATRGMQVACAITGRDPVPIDQSLLPFVGPQVVIDQDEFERGAATARHLLEKCGIEGVRAKPPTPAEIIGSSGLGASYDRFPADQERAGREAAERIKAMMQ